MEDHSLIDGCIKGESWAQKQLYEKYAPAMMSICLRYVHEKETARRRIFAPFIVRIERPEKSEYTLGNRPDWLSQF